MNESPSPHLTGRGISAHSWTTMVHWAKLIPRRQRNLHAFLAELFPDPLELLITRDRDRPSVGSALKLARRILDISLHQVLDGVADGHQSPGPLRVVVHEDVIAFLRVRPKVKDLR